jgi:hypothetical protein
MALHSRLQPQRIYGLLQTRPDGSPPAQPAVGEPPGELRAAPLPLRRWVPPVRPQVRTFTSDLIRHARHTRLASGLGSATLTRSHPLTTGTMCWRRSDTVTGRRSPGCELVAPQRLEHHQLIPELPPGAPGEGSRRRLRVLFLRWLALTTKRTGSTSHERAATPAIVRSPSSGEAAGSCPGRADSRASRARDHSPEPLSARGLGNGSDQHC